MPSMSLILPLLLFFPLLCSSCCRAQRNITSDASALLAFKGNLSRLGEKSTFLEATWNESSASAICTSWVNVSCSNSSSNQSRVSDLDLPVKSLYGPVAPDTIGRLDALRNLTLRRNNLLGSLPPDFGNLSALLLLDISFNNFSGSIPDSLNSLTNLKSLNLRNNSFSGAIPPLNIPSLEIFNVSNNNLTGPIPATLARFPPSSFTGNGNLCGAPLQACSSVPSLSKGAIVGIVCGGAVAAALLLLLLCLLCRKRKGGGAAAEAHTRWRESTATAEKEEAEKEEDESNKLEFIDGKKLFDIDDLLRASAEMLGKGTLGSSYKAVLEDSQIVVTKRLRHVDDSRRNEFRQCIKAIGSLKHDNLLPLLAYYFGKGDNLLVYDFMKNGSLSALLHGEGKKPLDWEARVRIAATSARGLAFLHAHDMVHGNLKSSNVLLKRDLEACLADYHMLPFTPTAHLPIAYLAPEITHPLIITPPADVFSFGVLLLELLTAKDPLLRSLSSSSSHSDDSINFPRWVESVVHEECTTQIVDPSLLQSDQAFNEEEMVQLLQVAKACVAPSPNQRPSMMNVVGMIDNIRRTTDDNKSSN